MKIHYGVEDNYIDVTNVCYSKLIFDGVLEIPAGDDNRAKIFGDPLYQVVKHIKIGNDVYNHEKEVIINVTDRNYAGEKEIKQEAFEKMNQLTGWCSHDKASFLMDLIFNHNPNIVVEIGIWGGKSFIPMAIALKYLDNQGIIYGIDPWSSNESTVGFENEPENYDWWQSIDHIGVMNKFLNKLNEFDLTDVSTIIRSTSEDAEPINNIDIIYIDGNHSEDSALSDVKKWFPLVKNGGFIIFDDLNWIQTKKAVDWLDNSCHRITTFNQDNVWGIWIKTD